MTQTPTNWTPIPPVSEHLTAYATSRYQLQSFECDASNNIQPGMFIQVEQDGSKEEATVDRVEPADSERLTVFLKYPL